MAGFTTYDQIINAISLGRVQRPGFTKASIASAAGGWASLWSASAGGSAGIPTSGTFGTALTARQVDNTFGAALPFTNAAGGRSMHLLGTGVFSSVAAGVFVLVDRLLEAPFNGTTTNAQFNSGTPLIIPSRDINGSPSGNGLFMFVENVANTTTASTNIQVMYTNSQGVPNRITGLQATAAVGQYRIVTSNNMWLPLASGDTGVQSISGYTLSASLTSTQLNIVVCRPLCYVPVLTANSYTERDLVLQTPNLPRLYDGTALQWLLLSAATTSGTLHGNVVFAEN